MKLKHAIVLLLASLPFFKANAQEDIVYDQYYWNYYLANPAVAGATRCSHVLGTFKKQWVGMDDSPIIEVVSFRTRILKNVGIGAYVYNDKNGFSDRQGGEATFAYHIPLSQNYGYFMKNRDLQRQLSFGVSAVLLHFGFEDELFSNPNNQDDQTIGNGDTDKGTYFNANFGTYFLWDDFFAGVSFANLLDTELDELGKEEPVRALTYYIYAGYAFPMNETIDIEPSVMFIGNEEDERQLDVNLKYSQVLPDNPDFSYWLQLAYRHTLDKDNTGALAFSPMGGITWKGFHLGYAYTLGLTTIQRHNSGTHEVMLGYSWCKTNKFCR